MMQKRGRDNEAEKGDQFGARVQPLQKTLLPRPGLAPQRVVG